MYKIAITIDVETDWGGRLSVDSSNCMGIEKEIPYILGVLNELEIKATFFISCEIIDAYSEIIKKIYKNGHEIASHGFNHNIRYDRLTISELEWQIKSSKHLIEQTIGMPPTGFRSPQLVTNTNLYNVLSKHGFKYDSSVINGYFPTRYNHLNVSAAPFRANGLWEVPLSTFSMLNIPMGLLWINAIGFGAFKLLFNKFKQNPVYVIYLHPFDLVEDKSSEKFNFIIDNWYNFKKGNVKKTFELLLNYLSTKGQFISINDILKNLNV